jgi:NAD(P)-dependent dehydrogenase (short-subunit alcohol dehydrogenase family)
MDLGLSGASVVIAGGTSGMGRAAAECFAADGARVAVLARSTDGVAAAEKELLRLGALDAMGVRADLTDASSVDAALAQVGDRWGHVNAVVNAAGPLTTPLKSFADYSDDEWLEVFSGITLGPVRTIRAALPYLQAAPWARVVNVSAMSTKHQSVSLVAYTAAKAALTSLTKNLSLTLAPHVLVNTVSPGTFASESFRQSLAPLPDVDENDLHDIMRYIGENFDNQVHLGRAADTSEIGPVIAFLASARNTYTTGANVNVDGGSHFA